MFTVPVVAIFTKFDGQTIKEYTDLSDMENIDKWDKARENAQKAFETVYLPKVLGTKYPPKGYVLLEGRIPKKCLHRDNSLADMDLEENNCPELAEKTADSVTDVKLRQLFVSTQMNNLDLSAKFAL